jgi:hypothetical protein
MACFRLRSALISYSRVDEWITVATKLKTMMKWKQRGKMEGTFVAIIARGSCVFCGCVLVCLVFSNAPYIGLKTRGDG